MASETVNTVMVAEKAADDRQAAAASQVAENLEKANDSVAELVKSRRLEAQAEAEKIIALAEKKAADGAADAEKQAALACKKITDSAREKCDEAVEAVLKILLD